MTTTPPLSEPPTPPLTPVTRLTNVRPWGGHLADIVIQGNLIAEVVPASAVASTRVPATQQPTTPGRAQGDRQEGDVQGEVRTTSAKGAEPTQGIVDGRGLLALPGLVNAHAHVDKSWLGLPWESYGGEATTQGRIAHERERRDALGIPSVELTERVLWQMVRHGTTSIRTHVDVDRGLGLAGIEAVSQAAQVFGDALTVQIVAFPQDGILRRPGVDKLLAQAAGHEGVNWVGGLDPAGIDRDPVGQIDLITGIARDTGTGIDIHLHDPAELGVFQIDLLCDYTEARGLEGRVNIAHGFALAQVSPARRAELLARLGELRMSFTTVAPLRLPQLPLAELADAGVRLGFGTDGIRDLWSPYGTGDTLGIAWQFGRASSANTDAALTSIVRVATDPWPVSGPLGAGPLGAGGAAEGETTSALEASLTNPTGLTPGSRADIVLLDAENPMDALVRTPVRELVIGGGMLLYER